MGRLLEETGFDGSRTHYRYDPSTGVLTHVQTGHNGDRVVSPEFDAAGRLIGRRAGLREPGTDTVRYTQEERFAYNGNGQMILAQNQASRLQWFHDAAGNVTREHQHYACLREQKVAV